MFPRDAVVEEGRMAASYEEDASRRDDALPGRRRIDDGAGAARDGFERRGERIVDCAADAVPQRCGERTVDCRGTEGRGYVLGPFVVWSGHACWHHECLAVQDHLCLYAYMLFSSPTTAAI